MMMMKRNPQSVNLKAFILIQ